MGTKEYIGLSLDGDLLKIARIRKKKKRWTLTHLDRVELKVSVDKERHDNRSKEMAKEYDEDFHFGIDHHYDEESQSAEDLSRLLNADKETNGSNNDSFHGNVLLLKEALEDISTKKVNIGTVIRPGDTNIQVLKDKNYGELKSKDLQAQIESHLKKVYGYLPDSDRYTYSIRKDGSLLLFSNIEESYLLKVLEDTRQVYSGKIKHLQMLPDETILATLVNKTYDLDAEEITCVIHQAYNRSRVFFMKGNQILQVIPPVEEGRNSSNVLPVIFSKMLFQLETGEISGLDRIILTNNDFHEASVNYFKRQFSDVKVEEFTFAPAHIEIPEHLKSVSGFFTSAIGMAWATAEPKDAEFSDYSLLPADIRERQNTLKLRWHGYLMIFLLLITPLVWNYLYQGKQQQITDLNNELFHTDIKIMNLEPVVAEANEIQRLYNAEQTKLELLSDLSTGTDYWSQNLKTLNDGLANIRRVWINSYKYVDDGYLMQGYSMSRERIPMVTNLFKRADLQAVTVVEMRDLRLYKFSIKVYYNFTDDLGGKEDNPPKNNTDN
ncbi:PilN domain-containing protein [Fodinibius salsisoli]|uniref:PilN domain-containing protein n=1 Tax=Fodinibius salsisoli TaxID=2820877 RepID=A0ABT3PM23_9BACT|nr:PilN domain-containing protein [Fodinibius salsisoli]MCW9706813.1 PilN domain-containing protein [Fodinibius salsisoli]